MLLVTDPAHPFSGYLAEILRAEGFDLFATLDLADVTPGLLAGHAVVVLGEMPLSNEQAGMFSDFVSAGGGLIAMRPDARLDGLMGVTRLSGTLDDRYLQVSTLAPPGAGITPEVIQYHGPAIPLTAVTATVVAGVRLGLAGTSPWSAVTLRSVGGNGGQAAAFAFDLARSVVTTRQGNPAWSGQERDGLPPLRSDDLFVGNAPGDPHPDWVDPTRIAIPQADELQRLFANLITTMALHAVPLPRFAYFPRAVPAVVVMTGDDHAHGGTVGRFEAWRAVSPAGCSAPDWECVRGTSYVFPGTPIPDSMAAVYASEGFEIALHTNTLCRNWPTAAVLDSIYGAQLGALAAQLPSNPAPATNRTHCIAWGDYSTQPHVEFAHGVRLDCTYYYWPNSFVANRPGVFTGSGLPMRFADADGSLIDVYQAATQMTDESQQTYPMTVNTLLDRALGSTGYYGAFVTNMHTDSVVHGQSAAIVASAQLRGVPVVSARQMLTWLDARNASAFAGVGFAGDTLGFTVTAPPDARGLRALVPLASSIGPLTAVERDGDAVAFTTTVMKGIAYAVVPAVPGHYVAHYAPDTQAPEIAGLSLIADGAGEASLIWTTDEPSTSLAWWGLDPATLDHQSVATPPVMHHHLQLTGLLPDTTYWVRVGSADAIGNLAVIPAPPAKPSPLFTGAGGCAADDTPAAFASGTAGDGVLVTARSASVVLRPAIAEEFPGPGVPAGWTTAVGASDGAVAVLDAGLALDGASAIDAGAELTDADAVELTGTLPATGAAALGLAASDAGAPACTFVVHDGVPAAITDDGAGGVDSTALVAPASGAHRFAIERDVASVRYRIDDLVVAEHARTVSGPLHAWALDGSADGAALVLARVLGGALPASGEFLSRIMDAGGPAAWRVPAASVIVPDGGAFALAVRAGSTASPDSTWTPWSVVTGGIANAALALPARYVQYRATLTAADPQHAPVLTAVTWPCTPPAPPTTGVGDAPRTLSWSRPSPNPSHGSVVFAIRLPSAGPVRLEIFAVDGRRVRTLMGGWHPVGALDVTWDGADDAGHPVAAGLYFARLDAGGSRLRQTVVRLR